MPEGDTIRRLAERINERFAGQRVLRCVTRDPRLVGVDLTGAVLLGADAHGKHLLIRFDDGRTLHAHLRMDGSWRVGPAATEPEWRRRIELWLDDGRLTGLDLPVVGVLRTDREGTVVGHLGPDVLGPGFEARTLELLPDEEDDGAVATLVRHVPVSDPAALPETERRRPRGDVRRVRRAAWRTVPWWRRWWWPLDPRVLTRR